MSATSLQIKVITEAMEKQKTTTPKRRMVEVTNKCSFLICLVTTVAWDSICSPTRLQIVCIWRRCQDTATRTEHRRATTQQQVSDPLRKGRITVRGLQRCAQYVSGQTVSQLQQPQGLFEQIPPPAGSFTEHTHSCVLLKSLSGTSIYAKNTV